MSVINQNCLVPTKMPQLWIFACVDAILNRRNVLWESVIARENPLNADKLKTDVTAVAFDRFDQ